MKFTIKGPEINIPEKISIRKPLLMMGSCFAENIGVLLKNQLFDININPFGIVYNPLSIINHLSRLINNASFNDDHIVEHNSLWFSWEHHGSYAGANKAEVLNQINTDFFKANEKIKNAEWLIITLGSAFYYQLNQSSQIVSNCHKLPAAYFTKKLAIQLEITQGFEIIVQELKVLNPKLKILFNVSPVRYTRDGLKENTLSKSILHLAIAELNAKFNNCFYFPSYEIVIDELRDYRFYKADMLHPNDTAIEYIYDKFATALFDEETKMIVKDIQQLNAFSNHKILNQSNEAIQRHLLKKNRLLQDLFKKYPFIENIYQTRKS